MPGIGGKSGFRGLESWQLNVLLTLPGEAVSPLVRQVKLLLFGEIG
jgi:hypothetical protein